jgi:myo-inositol-1(or 4)-monophosphatase
MAPDASPALAVDWLGLCRRAKARVGEALEHYPLPAERGRGLGRGEGGDTTLAIDRAAEDAIFAELQALGVGLTAVSEERGVVDLAGGGPVRVVIDPIDGSVNAKRLIPFYGVSIAVAGGPTMGDVEFGYVSGPGPGEEWWARKGEGAHQGNVELPPLSSAAELEILGLERITLRGVTGEGAEALAKTRARKVRSLGSIALSLAYVGAGRMDGIVTLEATRSVDCAAGQLILREAGGSVAFPEVGLAARLDLEARYLVVGAASDGLLDRLLPVVAAAAPPSA